MMEKKKKYKTGLVLSGGGTRGFGHLGVIKALEEEGIQPDIVSGVSAGAIVGALYADGNSPDEILETLSSKRIFDYLDFNIPRTGLVRMNGFEKTLKKYLKAKIFEDLKIPLMVFAVNMNTAHYVCFEKGNLALAVKASSSVPIVFPPIEVNGDLYCDGGVINNFPVEPLRKVCDKVIGVNVNPLVRRKTGFHNLKQIAERTFQLSVRSHVLNRKELCDLFIEPVEADNFGLLDLSSGKAIFKVGYEYTKKLLENNEL
ncbi:MAG: patatin-like phospholipase family protein [Bacteroidota bacterium]